MVLTRADVFCGSVFFPSPDNGRGEVGEVGEVGEASCEVLPPPEEVWCYCVLCPECWHCGHQTCK